MEHILKCYRVWFTDGSAMLCDAPDAATAKIIAMTLLAPDDDRVVDKAEQLTAKLIG